MVLSRGMAIKQGFAVDKYAFLPLSDRVHHKQTDLDRDPYGTPDPAVYYRTSWPSLLPDIGTAERPNGARAVRCLSP